jgi:hypothetical protein
MSNSSPVLRGGLRLSGMENGNLSRLKYATIFKRGFTQLVAFSLEKLNPLTYNQLTSFIFLTEN